MLCAHYTRCFACHFGIACFATFMPINGILRSEHKFLASFGVLAFCRFAVWRFGNVNVKFLMNSKIVDDIEPCEFHEGLSHSHSHPFSSLWACHYAYTQWKLGKKKKKRLSPLRNRAEAKYLTAARAKNFISQIFLSLARHNLCISKSHYKYIYIKR